MVEEVPDGRIYTDEQLWEIVRDDKKSLKVRMLAAASLTQRLRKQEREK